MTFPIYPLHCAPCLAKRNCQSLPHSVNCDILRRTEQDPAPAEPSTTAPAAPQTTVTTSN